MGRLIHPSMVNPHAMPFKLNFSPAKDFRLPGHAVIHVTGPDAQSFLQAQCMNDVNALEAGQWQYNGWLNPQGRVMALFYLMKIEAGHFLVILPALAPQWLIDGLKRFVFRAKVRFEVESTRHVLGSIGMAEAPEDHPGDDPVERVRIRIGHGESLRQLRLGTSSESYDSVAAQHWHLLDLAIGWVWIDEALQDLWTPQMLSLQQLQAFSLNKGCYPGQEIVARTHYLGKSKRALFVISGNGLCAGTVLTRDGRDSGRIVNATADGQLAAAVLAADTELNSVLDGGVHIEAPVSGR